MITICMLRGLPGQSAIAMHSHSLSEQYLMRAADVYQLGTHLLPHLPPSLGYQLCERLSLFAPLTPAWSQILVNMSYVLPDAPAVTRRRYARAIIAGLLKNYYDLLRSHALSTADLARSMEFNGMDNLHLALTAGKGAIIAMPHIGNFSLVAEPVATLAGTSMVVVVEEMPDPAVHALLNQLRRRDNVEIFAIGPHVVRRLIRALRENAIVVL